MQKYNLHIAYSHNIPKRFFDWVLNHHSGNEVLNHRSRFSLKMEWAVHNFLYNIGYNRKQTESVDLDYPCDKPEWVYKLFGVLVWPFIK